MPAIYKNGLLYAGTSGGSGANTDIIADEYTEKAYAVGDYCIHEDTLYKCNTAITVAESWTAAHWTATNIDSELDLKMTKTNPTGTGSFSLNRKANTTVGDYSFAEGHNCEASQAGSHAEGYNTSATSYYSHAEGYYTTASGAYSHAENYQTIASGGNAHADGFFTIAQRRNQHVFGAYNIADTGGTDPGTKGDYIEIVGNGTSSARSNARTLDWNGNEWIAGNYKSDALTASKLLVSDANKNIVSSSLAESDLITTSNIGSQSVDNATKWNGKTDDSSTANNTDTWIPVYASGKMQHTERVIPNSVTHTGYNTNQGRLATLAFLSFWNGAYNANGGSNLQYCDRGRFGTIVTKGSGDYAAASHTHSYLPLSGGTMTGDIIINTAKRIAYGTQCSIQSLGSNNTICLCGNAYAQVRRQDNPNTNQGIYAAAFTVSSSKLIKENIKNLSEEEAKKLLNIRVVDFDYIEKVGGEKDQHGVIAEEVLDILPYVVSIPDNYNEDEEKQKIESDSDEIINVLGVDYAKFTPYLIKMVQMQQKQIDNLQQEINELKYGNHA